MTRWDILRINLAAGIIAGALIGIGEIVIGEMRLRMKTNALVADLTGIGEKTAPDGTGE